MCKKNIKTNIKYTKTLCSITLQRISYCFFPLKCASSCDWCHMPFYTLLWCEILKLCLIRNRIDIIELRTILSLIDWTISDMQNEKDYLNHYIF